MAIFAEVAENECIIIIIQKTMYQISSESPTFCTGIRYYKK